MKLKQISGQMTRLKNRKKISVEMNNPLTTEIPNFWEPSIYRGALIIHWVRRTQLRSNSNTEWTKHAPQFLAFFLAYKKASDKGSNFEQYTCYYHIFISLTVFFFLNDSLLIKAWIPPSDFAFLRFQLLLMQ